MIQGEVPEAWSKTRVDSPKNLEVQGKGGGRKTKIGKRAVRVEFRRSCIDCDWRPGPVSCMCTMRQVHNKYFDGEKCDEEVHQENTSYTCGIAVIIT